MKRSFKVLAGPILAAAFAVPTLRAAHVVERIIARVNSEIITQHQYERERDKLRDELSQQYSGAELEAKVNDESKNLLRNLVDQSLMVQKAKDEDVNIETDLDQNAWSKCANRTIWPPSKTCRRTRNNKE